LPVQQNGHSAYRRVQTETSSPAQLIVLLYDGLLANLQRAVEGLATGHQQSAHDALIRAQEIILELMTSLDPEAGEMAEQLGAIYEYSHHQLVRANLEKDEAFAVEVRELLHPIRDSFALISETDVAAARSRAAGADGR
jgi:flagellar protein FliS